MAGFSPCAHDLAYYIEIVTSSDDRVCIMLQCIADLQTGKSLSIYILVAFLGSLCLRKVRISEGWRVRKTRFIEGLEQNQMLLFKGC